MVVDSSSDADSEIFYPPRTDLRPRPLTVDIAPAVHCFPHDATLLDPVDTGVDANLDDTVATTLLQSPQQQADSLQVILKDHSYTPEDNTWVSELATRRQVARHWARDNPDTSLPWHLATVLSQDIFDDDTRARIRQFDVISGRPKTLAILYPSTSEDDRSTVDAPVKTKWDSAPSA